MQLSVVKTKPSQITKLEQKIRDIIIEALYMPILKDIHKSKKFLLTNDKSYIQQAVLSGKIKIANGVAKGSFGSKIIKEFNSLGYKYDSRIKGFRVTLNKLTPSIQSAVSYASTINTKNAKVVVDTLDNLDLTIDANSFTKEFEPTLKTLDTGVNKNLKSVDIAMEVTPEERELIAKDYSKNLSVFVQGFVDEEVLKLREQVEKAFVSGQRAESLESFIKERFNVSENKARFLARQEMSLVSSKYKEDRYKQAGVEYYKWSTSNDSRVRGSHEDLNGRIFRYDDPPIVDKETGKRANPGEDFGCRCVAIPVIGEEINDFRHI